MSVECTTCGHQIPAGQFRCGKCGALAPRESLDDFGGLTEVLADSAQPAPAGEADAAAAPALAPVAPLPTPLRPPAQERRSGELAVASPAGGASDSSQQIETVPKGTFASETPHAPFPIRDEHAAESKATASTIRETPTPAAQAAATRGAASSSSQRVRQLAPQRPPFLASEILREDLVPVTPGKSALFAATQVAGLLGLVGTLVLGYASLYGLLAAVACAGLVVLGRIPVDYSTRAAAVAALSGLALTACVTMRSAMGASTDGPLLALACALLPGALLFRSWYRGAPLARWLVAATLVLAFSWAALTSHRGLLSLVFTWQSWLPALAWYLFCILCLLSLLAFMGDETTGGCGAWALGLCTWFALFALLRVASELDTLTDDVRATASATAGAHGALAYHALGLAEAAFAAPFAVAIAQLIARAFVGRQQRAIVAS